MSWWVADLWSYNPLLLFSWVFWVIVSIVLHELGHGWAAIRRGDDTPIVTGHMTLNPLVHMGPISLFVFLLIGFAWGAMPVNPSRFKGRHADAAVAAAGPAMNVGLAMSALVLATLCAVYLPRLGASPEVADRFELFFAAGSMLNVCLALFNLVPIPPLDGSTILASYSRRYAEFLTSEIGRGVSFIAMGVMFFTAGRYLFAAGSAAYAFGSVWLTSVLP